ncbi:MAG TPA: thioredoxin domain-containing protein [Gammaproteobacteria bacterium]
MGGKQQAEKSPDNRLDAETSPYLLQHADNPVAWQPWDEAALGMAREKDKPVLLSIGYSACHWCHVMAHESFEDAETAALMNDLFVNIKIDREERPDLDRVYQVAHQVLAQRPGGWPLTVFLAPDDLTPFFAGTYFPREPRFGMPGFKDVLQRVHAAYREHRAELAEQNAALRGVFRKLDAVPLDASQPLDDAPVTAARRILETEFDADNGGFGGAPKFPHPSNLEFLLRHSQLANDAPAGRMALFSLRCMAGRGLHDHVGGGFFRYCVDAAWRIPHFEKMLYDNGPLLALYADAFAISKDDMFHRVASETANWAIREMRSPQGGFYSSLDADAGGREGGFHAWTREQVHAALEDEPSLEALVVEHYGLDGEPNFEGEWHLNIHRDAETLAKAHGASVDDMRARIAVARKRLFDFRERREHPGRDEKILASWNALMIRGLARAARRLDVPAFAEAADGALGFIRAELWRDGRLSAVHKDGVTRFNAYLDDYAYLLDAVLELLQCRWRSEDLAFARELADSLLERFEDRGNGGFFFTSHDHEALIHRPKPFADEAMPSGNGIAAGALVRLAHLAGETAWLNAAERCLRAGFESIRRAPSAHGSLLDALRLLNNPGEIVILRGEAGPMRAWQQDLERAPRLDRMVFAIPAGETGLPEALEIRKQQGDCIAYVCRGFSCSPPITSREALLQQLSAVY